MFLKYITENNSEQVDLTKTFIGIKRVVVGDKFTDYVTPKEIKDVVSYMQMWTDIYKDHYPKSNERYAYRNAFLLILYCLTGARGDEAAHIRLKDIQWRKDGRREYYVIKIEKGKGGKKRYIHAEKKYIGKFVDYFRAVLPDESYYISSTYKKGVGYTNKPADINGVRRFGNRILGLMGINKTGLHIFRRGYVTKRIAVDGENTAIVAKEVGNTTAILEKHYLKHNADTVILAGRK
jgi:integrase/recombinase XerD